MTNTSISRTFRRHLVVGLAALTAFSSFAGSAVAVKADPVYDTSIESNDLAMDINHAVVKQTIGCIPVVGQFAAECLDPLLSELFGGGESSEILSRLDDISNQIKQLSAQVDSSTQKILVKMYRDSLNTFNQDLTSITNIEQDLLTEIKSIESDKNLSEVAKALKIGALLDNSSTDTAQFINKLNTCASYVEGTQAEVSSMPDNIYEKAYKINCCSSKLGGEAALKASGYINKVNTILDTGFKLESLVVNSKILAANLLNDMPADQREACVADLNRYFDGQTKAKALLSQCLNYVNAEDKESESNMSSWKTAAGIQNKDGSFTGVKGKFEAICDTEKRNSIAAQYNNMVNTVWFDYISEARYNEADDTIYPRYISLSKELT
ncbi:MAG: hypothetical protein KBS83_03840, partial [Lachnospiraceae bacterium]|nr:hypothetical protein [Candidatus Equihabitans merdae]